MLAMNFGGASDRDFATSGQCSAHFYEQNYFTSCVRVRDPLDLLLGKTFGHSNLDISRTFRDGRFSPAGSVGGDPSTDFIGGVRDTYDNGFEAR
jgi:hypothetical protein